MLYLCRHSSPRTGSKEGQKHNENAEQKHKISRRRRRRRRKAGRKTRTMLPRLITSCRETVGEAAHAELAFAAVAEFTKSASIEAAAMVSRNRERERERERDGREKEKETGRAVHT
jgi:hypothetical protein